MKRALSGQLPLLPAIKKLMDEVTQPPSFDSGADAGERLTREGDVLAAVKKIALFCAGVVSQRFMTALQDQQEVMADLAAIIMQVYALESALLRARKLAIAGHNSAEAAEAMTGLLATRLWGWRSKPPARAGGCAEGDLLRTQLAILRRLARFTPANAIGLSRTVARHCIQLERYPL